jgi:Uma2 family endonuclease
MAPAANLVSVEEYLATHYEPNCEYEDGVVYPKPMPTFDHAAIIAHLIYLIRSGYPNLIALPELTVRIRENKWLVPDLVIQPAVNREKPYPTEPLPLCVEVAFPGQGVGALLAKCEQYHRRGVPTTWVIDPASRRAWVYHRNSAPNEVPPHGNLEAEGISIPLPAILAGLD